MKSTSEKNTQTLNGEAQFTYAEQYARDSNWKLRQSQAKYRAYTAIKNKLTLWTQYFDNSFLVTMTLLWVIACIAEAAVSYELYREMSANMPPVICILGFAAIGIINSHLFRLFAPEIWRFEKFYNFTMGNGKLLMDIEEEMLRKRRLQLIIGLFVFAAVSALLIHLSIMRVGLEIAAGVHKGSHFNAMDTLPIVFYVLEVILGVYVISMIKGILLLFKHRQLKQQRERLLRQSIRYNERCGAYYKEARKSGCNEMESEELYNALQRYFHESVGDPTILVLTEEEKSPLELATDKGFPELNGNGLHH